MRLRERLLRGGIVLVMLVAHVPGTASASEVAYRFVCEGGQSNATIVDVLEQTGEHVRFLELLRSYDPEGYEILADPELADKTVWAPTDAAFAAVSDRLAAMTDAEIKAVLGYHISPPRSAPGGAYPIVTFDLLIDAGTMTHRTRTGVLNGTDERTQTSYADGVLTIEDTRILETAWCTAAGSVFSIDAVITAVAPPSTVVWLLRRVVRILLYEDIRFVIYSTVGAMVIGSVVAVALRRRSRSGESEDSRRA